MGCGTSTPQPNKAIIPPAKVDGMKPADHKAEDNKVVQGPSPAATAKDNKETQKVDKPTNKIEERKVSKKEEHKSPAKEVAKEMKTEAKKEEGSKFQDTKTEAKKEENSKPQETKPEEKAQTPEEKKTEANKLEEPKPEEKQIKIEEWIQETGFGAIMGQDNVEEEPKHEVHSFACSGFSSIIQVCQHHDPLLAAAHPNPATLSPIREGGNDSSTEPFNENNSLFVSATSQIITSNIPNQAIAPPPSSLAIIPEEAPA